MADMRTDKWTVDMGVIKDGSYADRQKDGGAATKKGSQRKF